MSTKHQTFNIMNQTSKPSAGFQVSKIGNMSRQQLTNTHSNNQSLLFSDSVSRYHHIPLQGTHNRQLEKWFKQLEFSNNMQKPSSIKLPNKLSTNKLALVKDSMAVKIPAVYPMLTRNDFSKSMTSSFIHHKKASFLNSNNNSPKKPICSAIPIIKRIKLRKDVLKSRCRSRADLFAQ